MKLVSGHTYLRGPNGEVVPYNERIAKASGYDSFIQDGDFENDMQLEENKKVVARKSIPVTKQVEVKAQAPKPVAKSPVVAKGQVSVEKKNKFPDGHMDIREDMNQDLSGLEG